MTTASETSVTARPWGDHASAVSITMFWGWPACPEGTELSMNSSGYAPRFSHTVSARACPVSPGSITGIHPRAGDRASPASTEYPGRRRLPFRTS